MQIPVVVLTNRRDLYLPQALASLNSHVSGFGEVVIVDDSGDKGWRDRLASDADTMVTVADQPAGYTRAMKTLWRVGADLGGPVFMLEEDFTFRLPVNLRDLAIVLTGYPKLAQIALQRAPWYPVERRLGVLAAQRRRVDRERRIKGRRETTWRQQPHHVEHDAGFTGNPSLISPRAFEVAWPDCDWSETAMGDRLVEAGFRFGWYGREGDAPHVEHVGGERAEHSAGY